MDQTNLLAAQKVDSRIVEVLDSAPSVAIYFYSDAKKTWEKSEHEGALLVCRCNGTSQHCFIILNQLKPQNFIQHLDGGMSLQRKNEYLMYKAPSVDAVRAIWFYNPADCERIYELLQGAVNLAKQAEQKNSAPSASGSSKSSVKEVTHGQDAKMGKDILSMLSSAHKNYDPRVAMPVQGRGAAGDGGGTQVVRPIMIGGGGDARPIVGQQLSSSIPLENFFKNFHPAHNGAPQPVDHRQAHVDVQPQNKEQPPASPMAGLGGLGMMATAKGRGRPLTNETTTATPVPTVAAQSMAPLLQRLLTPGNAAGDQQQQPVTSAFTNVAPRQNQRVGPIGAGNGTGTAADSFSAMRLESPVGPGVGASSPLMGSLLSPGSIGLNERGDMELLTPADLSAAIHGHDVAAFNRAVNALPFSPPGSFTGQSHQGISPPSATSMLGQPVAYTGQMVEQFRQCFIHLLQSNQDFVQRLYDAFVQENARRGSPGFGPGGSEAWRKN